jgi:hypothetical protein
MNEKTKEQYASFIMEQKFNDLSNDLKDLNLYIYNSIKDNSVVTEELFKTICQKTIELAKKSFYKGIKAQKLITFLES